MEFALCEVVEKMSEKKTVAVPTVKLISIQVSDDSPGDALLTFEIVGDTNLALVLPISALAEIEAKLAMVSLEMAKDQPKQ